MEGELLHRVYEHMPAWGLTECLEWDPTLPERDYERALELGKREFCFLMMVERSTGEDVGVLGCWARSPLRGWPALLYGVAPAHRLRGFAVEAARALMQAVLDHTEAPGVGALVDEENAEGLRMALRLGMRPRLHVEDKWFFVRAREEFYREGSGPEALVPAS